MIATAETLTPDAEWTVLDDLLRSEGWAVYETAMRTRWSAEQYEADVRNAMTEARPGTDVTSIVGQINATYAGMRKMLAWPHDRMRAVRAGQGAVGRFDDVYALFRRGPKRA